MRPLSLTEIDRETLERWVRSGTTPQRLVLRSRIILLLGEGHSTRRAAERAGTSRQTVQLWRRRFLEGGCALLVKDKPGRGRKRTSAGERSRASGATTPASGSGDGGEA
jgi:hypothetical protein